MKKKRPLGKIDLNDLWGSLFPLVHKLSPSVDKPPQRSISLCYNGFLRRQFPMDRKENK